MSDGSRPGRATGTRSLDRAVALVRALGTTAEGDGAYLDFARDTILAHEPVRHLSALVGEGGVVPLSSEGAIALKRARAALAGALDFSVPYRDALAAVEASSAEVERIVSRSSAALRDPDAELPDLLWSSDVAAFARYQHVRLSALCYFTAMVYGTRWLAPLRGVSLGSGTERALISAGNAIGELRSLLSNAREVGAWRIDQTAPIGCECVPAASTFVLRWLGNKTYDGFVREAGLREIAPGFATGTAGGARVYAGRGNIVGTPPEASAALREKGVHTEFPPYAFGGLYVDLDRPLSAIAAAFGDNAYCIDPEDFALALSRHARCAAAGGA